MNHKNSRWNGICAWGAHN